MLPGDRAQSHTRLQRHGVLSPSPALLPKGLVQAFDPVPAEGQLRGHPAPSSERQPLGLTWAWLAVACHGHAVVRGLPWLHWLWGPLTRGWASEAWQLQLKLCKMGPKESRLCHQCPVKVWTTPVLLQTHLLLFCSLWKKRTMTFTLSWSWGHT